MNPWRRLRVKARQILAQHGVVKPPVDVERLARRMGIRVVEERLEDQVSGMLYREGDHAVILINSEEAPVRKRFSIAHELGHYCLHKDPVFVDRRVLRRDPSSSLGLNSEEIEANRFAAELLMPASMVFREVDRQRQQRVVLSDEDLLEELARVFQVSRQAMEYRLGDLGVLGTF